MRIERKVNSSQKEKKAIWTAVFIQWRHWRPRNEPGRAAERWKIRKQDRRVRGKIIRCIKNIIKKHNEKKLFKKEFARCTYCGELILKSDKYCQRCGKATETKYF